MSYRILSLPSAKKALAGLQEFEQARIDAAILALGDDPRPHGVKKLRNQNDLYRVRVGNYRIVYKIDDQKRAVTIAIISHRKDVYRGM